MDSISIKDILPYRYPALMVDKVLEVLPRQYIVAVKNISYSDPFLQSFVPELPGFPGSMILECMVQTASILLLRDAEFANQAPSLNDITKMAFKKDVVPGDQMRLEVELSKIKDNIVLMYGKALVDGKIAGEGEFSFALRRKPSRPQIHPTASVDSSAVLGKDVIIGPYTIIGENVIIKDRTVLEANIMVEKYTQIGEDCHIHFGCVIGSDAQDIKYNGEKTWVVIGDRNQIREYVTINRSTGANTITKIGSDNMFLTHVHIGHNCELGDRITIANSTNLAGHTIVEDNAVIGGMTGIHQYVRIGKGAMVGAYTRLPQDVAPYTLCEGNPATIKSINIVGLRRQGASKKAIREIIEIYKLFFRSGLNSGQALEEIEKKELGKEPESQRLLNFIRAESKRGLLKKADKQSDQESEKETQFSLA